MEYSIYLCRKCGAVCAAREGATTFTCLTCGTRNDAGRSVNIVKKVDSKNIHLVISKLKMERAKKSSTL